MLRDPSAVRVLWKQQLLCYSPTNVSILILQESPQRLIVEPFLILRAKINNGFVGAIFLLLYRLEHLECARVRFGIDGDVAKEWAIGSILAFKDLIIPTKATYVITTIGPKTKPGDVQKIATKSVAHHSAKIKMEMLAMFLFLEEVHQSRIEEVLHSHLKIPKFTLSIDNTKRTNIFVHKYAT